jgi:imidazoleglycerol phosphate dehydratase HisB
MQELSSDVKVEKDFNSPFLQDVFKEQDAVMSFVIVTAFLNFKNLNTTT